LAATRRGLLKVRRQALADANAREGISIFTLFDSQPVEPGETVGKCKVTPLVIPAETLAAVEKIARDAHGLVAVSAFRPTTVGAVAQERLDAKQRARFEAALKQKIEWFGGRLLPITYAGGSPTVVADALTALRRDGAEVLIVAGASALDPLDPVFGGLTLLGARMERHGAPAHPGSLLFLARWQDLPVLGMPTCGMFSQATTFDLVLPRLLAGEAIANAEIAALGLGGRALGADRGPLAGGGGGARRRRRARRAAGRRAADADALRDAAHHRAREGAGMTLDAQARRDFPILERIVNGRPLVYLDSAASSHNPRSVFEAMSRYYETSHANVHRSIHTLGEEA